MQRRQAQNATKVTVVGETKTDVRDTLRKEPIISDKIVKTCLKLVFCRATRAQHPTNLGIDVHLGHINALKDCSPSLGLPPS